MLATACRRPIVERYAAAAGKSGETLLRHSWEHERKMTCLGKREIKRRVASVLAVGMDKAVVDILLSRLITFLKRNR